jgi:hypothetical protein
MKKEKPEFANIEVMVRRSLILPPAGHQQADNMQRALKDRG